MIGESKSREITHKDINQDLSRTKYNKGYREAGPDLHYRKPLDEGLSHKQTRDARGERLKQVGHRNMKWRGQKE